MIITAVLTVETLNIQEACNVLTSTQALELKKKLDTLLTLWLYRR